MINASHVYGLGETDRVRDKFPRTVSLSSFGTSCFGNSSVPFSPLLKRCHVELMPKRGQRVFARALRMRDSYHSGCMGTYFISKF